MAHSNPPPKELRTPSGLLPRMGIFRVCVRVFNLQDPGNAKEIEVVVDTGATYPVVPRGLADELGLRTVEARTFTLANGVEVSRSLAWAGLSFDGRSSPSLVVVGEAGGGPIPGAFALEGLGLGGGPRAQNPPAAPHL